MAAGKIRRATHTARGSRRAWSSDDVAYLSRSVHQQHAGFGRPAQPHAVTYVDGTLSALLVHDGSLEHKPVVEPHLVERERTKITDIGDRPCSAVLESAVRHRVREADFLRTHRDHDWAGSDRHVRN